PKPTTTVVTSNRTPSANLGQSITFTATVKPTTGASIPTGTVQFTIDGTNAGAAVTLGALPFNLFPGTATYRTSSLAAGSHDVVAQYTSNTGGFLPSTSATLVQVVTMAASTTVVTSSASPSVVGQSVTYTAQVTPVAATGTVTFTVDGTAVGGTKTLDATGRATLPSNVYTATGPHTVVATYGGSATYQGSSNTAFTQTVNKASTRSTVTSSRLTATRNTPVTFTATVTSTAPGSGTPQGTARFRIDGTLGAPVDLNAGGVATLTTSSLSVGSHTVAVVYAGNPSYLTSTSGNIVQRIQ
ncbi:MAG TPA: Ig-like domain-containing protein, partial [Nakamurella sp.]|nr:Ig-like domain-containing protein [Nakamurella sp.]